MLHRLYLDFTFFWNLLLDTIMNIVPTQNTAPRRFYCFAYVLSFLFDLLTADVRLRQSGKVLCIVKYFILFDYLHSTSFP